MAKKHIKFEEINWADGDKHWLVKTHRGVTIARIEYYRRWKRWVLAPMFESVWTSEYLKQIIDFLNKLEKGLLTK